MHLIERKFHFHAAHRNTQLEHDKCSSLHGHTYHLTVIIKNYKSEYSGVGMLFDDLAKKVEKLVKLLDHSFIVYEKDPVYEALLPFGMRMYPLKVETSAENLAEHIFDVLKNKMELPVAEIHLQETTTSKVIYSDGDMRPINNTENEW